MKQLTHLLIYLHRVTNIFTVSTAHILCRFLSIFFPLLDLYQMEIRTMNFVDTEEYEVYNTDQHILAQETKQNRVTNANPLKRKLLNK